MPQLRPRSFRKTSQELEEQSRILRRLEKNLQESKEVTAKVDCSPSSRSADLITLSASVVRQGTEQHREHSLNRPRPFH